MGSSPEIGADIVIVVLIVGLFIIAVQKRMAFLKRKREEELSDRD